jgi:hypothetical protein
MASQQEREVPADRNIHIAPGTMLNLSGNEDDESWIAAEPIDAIVVEGWPTANGTPIRIPEMADTVLYLHRPERAGVSAASSSGQSTADRRR